MSETVAWIIIKWLEASNGILNGVWALSLLGYLFLRAVIALEDSPSMRNARRRLEVAARTLKKVAIYSFLLWILSNIGFYLIAGLYLGDSGLLYVLGKDYMAAKGVSALLPKAADLADKFLR